MCYVMKSVKWKKHESRERERERVRKNAPKARMIGERKGVGVVGKRLC